MRPYLSPLPVVQPEQSFAHRSPPFPNQLGARESEIVN
jgi:hypothetical protein